MMTVFLVVYFAIFIATLVLAFLIYREMRKGNKLLEEYKETSDFQYETLMADIIKELKDDE